MTWVSLDILRSRVIQLNICIERVTPGFYWAKNMEEGMGGKGLKQGLYLGVCCRWLRPRWLSVDMVWGHQIQVIFEGCQWVWGVTQQRSGALGIVQHKGVKYQQQKWKIQGGRLWGKLSLVFLNMCIMKYHYMFKWKCGVGNLTRESGFQERPEKQEM